MYLVYILYTIFQFGLKLFNCVNLISNILVSFQFSPFYYILVTSAIFIQKIITGSQELN